MWREAGGAGVSGAAVDNGVRTLTRRVSPGRWLRAAFDQSGSACAWRTTWVASAQATGVVPYRQNGQLSVIIRCCRSISSTRALRLGGEAAAFRAMPVAVAGLVD